MNDLLLQEILQELKEIKVMLEEEYKTKLELEKDLKGNGDLICLGIGAVIGALIGIWLGSFVIPAIAAWFVCAVLGAWAGQSIYGLVKWLKSKTQEGV